MLENQVISLESEAGFRALFEYATVGILVISSDGTIQLANPCTEKLFGYSNAELIGNPIEILIPAALRKKHEHHRDQYFEKPKARAMGYGLNLLALKKDGIEFPVEISLGHYLLGNEELAVAFVTDITEQVKAKQIIEEREAMFRNMSNNSPIMIWVSGPDKLRTYFNNTWLDFTGRTMQQESGFGWKDDVHPEDMEKFLAVYNHAFDSQQPYKMEYRLRRHDGQYRWVQGEGKPTFSPENLFTGFIGSCYEIHAQKMMNEELEIKVVERTLELTESLVREKELNELKSRFVSMASHEFRTPLTGILTSISLIESYTRTEDEEKRKRHAERIKSSVRNLTSILNDFLSLDKLEQGKIEIVEEKFNFNDFADDIIEEVTGMLKQGQRIKFSHRGEKEIVQDKKILKNVLLNLLSNAIKYSEENKTIHLLIEVGKNVVAIKVRDEGIGIPEEEQKNLFNKFFRARNVTNIQGTGLGLNIVQKYVELIDGSISFISKPNEGTTFTVRFPQNNE